MLDYSNILVKIFNHNINHLQPKKNKKLLENIDLNYQKLPDFIIFGAKVIMAIMAKILRTKNARLSKSYGKN